MTREHQARCDEVLTVLRRVTRAIDLHSKAITTRHGLTTPQLIVLREIARLVDVSAGQLAKNVNLSNGTLTGILDRLEKQSLIARQRRQPDKRRVLIQITPKGQEVLRSAPPLLQERFVEQFAKLQDWEQTQILSSLQRVASMMEAQYLDAAPILVTGEITPTDTP